jgi:hypothetical protein
MGSLVWLRSRLGLGFRRWNLVVLSVARYRGTWFLGAFGVWLPLPVQWGTACLQAIKQAAAAALEVRGAP